MRTGGVAALTSHEQGFLGVGVALEVSTMFHVRTSDRREGAGESIDQRSGDV
jgi:hypothetical protein